MSSLIVPGGVETRYSCCENAVGSPGCQVFNVLLFMLKLYLYTFVGGADFSPDFSMAIL